MAATLSTARRSYGAASLHFGAFALGVLLTGVLADRPVRLLGRKSTLWGGASGMAAGAMVLVAGSSATIILAATSLMCFCGSLPLMTAQATLSDLHGDNRAVASFAEANVAATVLAPVAVGFFAAGSPGWRAVPLAAVPILAVDAFFSVRVPVPDAETSEVTRGGHAASLRPAFWATDSPLIVLRSFMVRSSAETFRLRTG